MSERRDSPTEEHCAICLLPLSEPAAFPSPFSSQNFSSEPLLLPCCHHTVFHSDCLYHALSEEARCPICRCPDVPDVQDDDSLPHSWERKFKAWFLRHRTHQLSSPDPDDEPMPMPVRQRAPSPPSPVHDLPLTAVPHRPSPSPPSLPAPASTSWSPCRRRPTPSAISPQSSTSTDPVVTPRGAPNVLNNESSTTVGPSALAVGLAVGFGMALGMLCNPAMSMTSQSNTMEDPSCSSLNIPIIPSQDSMSDFQSNDIHETNNYDGLDTIDGEDLLDMSHNGEDDDNEDYQVIPHPNPNENHSSPTQSAPCIESEPAVSGGALSSCHSSPLASPASVTPTSEEDHNCEWAEFSIGQARFEPVCVTPSDRSIATFYPTAVVPHERPRAVFTSRRPISNDPPQILNTPETYTPTYVHRRSNTMPSSTQFEYPSYPQQISQGTPSFRHSRLQPSSYVERPRVVAASVSFQPRYQNNTTR